MKTINRILLSVVLMMATLSCDKGIDEFLDKAPGVDITEDVIFSSPVQLETFVTGTYRIGLHSIFAYNEAINPLRTIYTLNAGATDEAEAEVSFFHTQTWNAATFTPNDIVNNEDNRWPTRWTAIRNCNIILERIGQVPGLTDPYKNQVIGEVKFIRALNYFEMLKRYGGVPILDKRFSTNENYVVKRNTVAETIDFILKDCEDAINGVPATYPANQRGRITQSAARMLKSRTLLFAASPLFNTADPYLSLGSANNLICLGNYDATRWQTAADAAKAVIDNAAAGSFGLVDDKGVTKNYKFVWEQPDNKEIVLAEKLVASRSRTQFPFYGMEPVCIINAWGGVLVTHTFVMKYDKRDGTPQTWDMVAGGSDLVAKYNELDYRFAQTVGYNGSYFNADHPVLQTYQGGKHSPDCRTGAWMKKFLPDQMSQAAANATPNGILFRLAEAYLNYAEALNEAQGPTPEAYAAVNIIRQRSGMADLPAGLTQDQFREKVRKERDIELAFEDHRLWDIRRWMVAENDGVMKGKFWGLKIFTIPASTEFRYEPFNFETRTFNRNMYLHPFPQAEVNKGYLVQNPGW